MSDLDKLRARLIERFRYRVRFLTVEQNVALIRRLLRNVSPGSKGCALWNCNVTTGGYPRLNIRLYGHHHTLLAHRLAWQLANGGGDIPHWKEAAHDCDTPPCIHPDHLEAQRRRDNRVKSAMNTNAKKAARRAAEQRMAA